MGGLHIQKAPQPESCTPMELAEKYRATDPIYANEVISIMNLGYPEKKKKSSPLPSFQSYSNLSKITPTS